MADERLYVKIVMPKQGVERPKQGGSGEIKNFHTVTIGFFQNKTLNFSRNWKTTMNSEKRLKSAARLQFEKF